MSKKTKSVLSAAIKAAVALAIFVTVLLNYDKLKNLDIRALVDSTSSTAAAVAIILGIYFVKSVLFIIPASLIYISVGTAFSPLQAVLINLAGIVVEITATYLLGIFLGGDYVNRLLSKSKGGKKILESNINNKFLVLLPVRFLPAFPIDFVSLFLGASKCRFPVYFAASVLGIMPRVILLTVLGDGIYNLIPTDLLIKIVLCVLPPAVIAWLIVKAVKKKKGEKSGEE